jgi:addiction module RelB/DinJ family antitoxin
VTTKEKTMATMTIHVDEAVKAEADAVLAELGLTASVLVRTLPTRIARDKAVQFDARQEMPVISEEEKCRRCLWPEQALASMRLEGHISTPEFLADIEAEIEGRITGDNIRVRSLVCAIAADRAAHELSDGEPT